jgi:hypothetical protein
MLLLYVIDVSLSMLSSIEAPESRITLIAPTRLASISKNKKYITTKGKVLNLLFSKRSWYKGLAGVR